MSVMSAALDLISKMKIAKRGEFVEIETALGEDGRSVIIYATLDQGEIITAGYDLDHRLSEDEFDSEAAAQIMAFLVRKMPGGWIKSFRDGLR